MNLFVVGANGRTGTHCVDLGLARGHRVTAFVRDPRRVTRTHERLTVVAGDPFDTHALAAALPRHDAVLSALGPRSSLFAPSTVVRDGAAALVAAMTRVEVQRLLFVSAATLFDLPFPQNIAKWILRNFAADSAQAETVIRASSLAWTCARPPRLVPGAAEAYRCAVDAMPPRAWSMTFRAVAAFLVDAAEKDAYVRRIVGLGS